MVPKTEEQYWQVAEKNKDALRKLVADWHPQSRGAGQKRTDGEFAITAPTTEDICDKIRDDIRKESGVGDPVAAFDKALADKDGVEFAGLLQATWFGLPESQGVRSLPGFFVLCNLCEESYLVVPETDNGNGDDPDDPKYSNGENE
jgi:hypothetical protein